MSGCLLIVLCWGGMCHLRIAAGRSWGDTGWWQLLSLQLCCSLKDEGWALLGPGVGSVLNLEE